MWFAPLLDGKNHSEAVRWNTLEGRWVEGMKGRLKSFTVMKVCLLLYSCSKEQIRWNRSGETSAPCFPAIMLFSKNLVWDCYSSKLQGGFISYYSISWVAQYSFLKPRLAYCSFLCSYDRVLYAFQECCQKLPYQKKITVSHSMLDVWRN